MSENEDRIKKMVIAGNHGWAILALLELLEVQPIKVLDAIEDSLKIGRLRQVILAAVREDIEKREANGPTT